MALYAVLSLTVVRMLPVFLSLAGTGMSSRAKLFVGWFGPRGLASIVFAVIVFDAKLPGQETLVVATACTVLLSVIAHGMTANPVISAMWGKSLAPAATVTEVPNLGLVQVKQEVQAASTADFGDAR